MQSIHITLNDDHRPPPSSADKPASRARPPAFLRRRRVLLWLSICTPSYRKVPCLSQNAFTHFIAVVCQIQLDGSNITRRVMTVHACDSPCMCLTIRLVLNCRLAHLNANARDESNANVNANAQHLNQMQMRNILIKCKCIWIKCKCI